MDVLTTYAYLPLGSLVAGAILGLIAGRFLGMKRFLWLLGALAALALVFTVRLAMIQPGDEEAGFVPFVALTGGLFPAIFGAIMGGLGGRALAKKA